MHCCCDLCLDRFLDPIIEKAMGEEALTPVPPGLRERMDAMILSDIRRFCADRSGKG